MTTMELAMEEIMSIRQEGTVFDYCSVFQSLFERVKNSKDVSEVYAIYLFIDGLEPRIREVFITWHQYSYHKVKYFISLALKIDANKLQDSFSLFDLKPSFYVKESVFDSRKILDEIMEGNESFKDVKIQEISNEDRVFDESAYKVFDEMLERFSGEIKVQIHDESENDNEKFENEMVFLNEDLSIQKLCDSIDSRKYENKDVKLKCLDALQEIVLVVDNNEIFEMLRWITVK
ncbi:hypothetical protein HanRHA438_Chr08g0337611 [Helianthus annuus]|nr:hypothetical protein HanHA300_Chr08g0269881 [Helianthus annuus]KAJ0545704.1 hypothetical protein HanIR_Chr08g0352731 [Helianthus annuus]KAJ0552573.1 hypothetical protein HanHA89_Chr08g0286731 [Helianthus annuus]KAJ0718268.1 hypothetical protein HanLR1_Chr08g0268751 [Helianthus annuus]KAJ0896706.1 hypothetical protein HanRHA438_Chr08g0337611 [Helianthus annuus]